MDEKDVYRSSPASNHSGPHISIKQEPELTGMLQHPNADMISVVSSQFLSY